MKRAALIATAGLAALICCGTADARTPNQYRSWWGAGPPYGYEFPGRPKRPQRGERPREAKTPRATDRAPPKAPLHVIVSIDRQTATLYADGAPYASTRISSGTPGHPTPMGVFTVIQKSRHHISNLYDAPMPYMQRITWSGSALHEGPLPGRPASHGCVRLTTDFAKLLWTATRIGTRVIITRDDVAPVPIEHPRLAALVADPAQGDEANAEATPVEIKVAETGATALASAMKSVRSGSGASTTHQPEPAPIGVQAAAPIMPIVSLPAPNVAEQQATKLLVAATAPEPPPRVAEPAPPPAVNRRPVALFVSLKDRRLYARQGTQPLFDMPIGIAHPDEPLGTHVFTAMGPKDGGGLRWTVVSIPSHTKASAEGVGNRLHRKNDRGGQASDLRAPAPTIPSAAAALDRFVLPHAAMERIAGLVLPGSSLIVSDNKLSDETNNATEFIVLTR